MLSCDGKCILSEEKSKECRLQFFIACVLQGVQEFHAASSLSFIPLIGFDDVNVVMLCLPSGERCVGVVGGNGIQRGVRGATAANRMVFRSLVIWFVIISAMTLYGLTQ